MSEATLFVRKASGLVRSWSVFDAFIYATFSINLITLGLFIFSYCWYFAGNLGTAVVVGGVFTIFEVILYASLISAMPRAGGDYVWQSRILGRGVGFLLAVTGWWFILWLWVPLYGQMLAYEFLTPITAILGMPSVALWFTTYPWGPLTSMLLVCLIVFIYIAIGMKWYARVQKFSFYVGTVGLAIVFALLLFGTRESFIAGLNANIPALFGVPEMDYYAATMEAGQAAGTTFGGLGVVALGASFALIPMIVFFNLWPNWGSTLYGEVRGASDYKRNFWGMAGAIIVTAALALVFFMLINKTMGWDFYMNANGAFWSNIFYGTDVPIPVWPYPVQFATFLTTSRALQFIVVLAVSFWWFGWSGTVFLSSTRVIFAAALDRMLPEWVSRIEFAHPHAGERPAADGDPVGDHLDHVRLQLGEHAVDRARCHAGHRHHLLWHGAGGHHPALAPEEHLRRLSDRQVQDARLAELDRQPAVPGGGAVSGVLELPVCSGRVCPVGGSDSPDATDDRCGHAAGCGQCGAAGLGGHLRLPQAAGGRALPAGDGGGADLLRLPRLAAGRVVL